VTIANRISYEGQPHVVLDGVSWEAYEQLLRDLGNRPIRVTYDRGKLEIMAPLINHERWKSRYGRLIEVMCEELDLDVEMAGSTTFRREDLDRGLEPDECYYLQHADAVRGKNELDLTVDPPPDLVIEVDITHKSVPKEPIYAALGAPELWRFDGKKLTVLRLRKGKYHPAASSGVFPFLPLERFQEFAVRLASERQPKVLREFRAWVRGL
jgi:Uma2 family endonuclease